MHVRPSAGWLLHNGDSISLSFPPGNFPPQTNICNLLAFQRYECDWNDFEDTFQTGDKFCKGELVVEIRTAYLEDTIENVQWRKDRQSYACDWNGEKLSKGTLVIEMRRAYCEGNISKTVSQVKLSTFMSMFRLSTIYICHSATVEDERTEPEFIVIWELYSNLHLDLLSLIFSCPSSSIPTFTYIGNSFIHSLFWIQLQNLDQTLPIHTKPHQTINSDSEFWSNHNTHNSDNLYNYWLTVEADF